ncbi:MAG TPA: methyltransferase [Dehalococcoidia bacterium]|nr:methyltransferase [Dehalococcoidia bacterium]
MTTNGNSRDRILKLFAREKLDRIPVFSGMGNITVHGLKEHDYKFAEIHTNARKMADAAASTYRLFGFECAVAPFDMGIEPEVLGCEINYYLHREEGILYPTVKEPLAAKIDDLNIQLPSNIADAGRVPVVTEAISLLKDECGDNIAIGSYVLGPYLITAQVVDIGDLAKACFKKPDLVTKAMEKTSELIIALSKIYRDAGADYITIREMGAGPDILSPRLFESLIMPHLKHIFANIDSPNVLHICGDTNPIIEQMVACGADAISVEEKNNLAETRKKLGPDTLIFGNIAGYNMLVVGKPDDVDKAVKAAVENGTSAIWPGCDIWPEAPEENMKAMMAAAEKYGRL